jgi:hypothetical protein
MRNEVSKDRDAKLRNPDLLNEGMQVLREYMHCCNLNFLDLCKKYDKDGSGSKLLL